MAELIHDLFGDVSPSPPKVRSAGQAHGHARHWPEGRDLRLVRASVPQAHGGQGRRTQQSCGQWRSALMVQPAAHEPNLPVKVVIISQAEFLQLRRTARAAKSENDDRT